MGETLTLKASDGHELRAYRAAPDGASRGGIIVLQEIFGVNVHIRDVCDRFAQDGFTAVAPALYDRSSQRSVELGYTPDDVTLGRKLREEFSWDDTMLDIRAAADVLTTDGLKAATVGYCWGGSISFLAATRLELSGAVVYYGGQIMPYVSEQPRCPLLMHFGKRDASIPLADVEAIKTAHPDADVHVYDAGHGFNCDRRASFDQTAAATARERTLSFFERHLS